MSSASNDTPVRRVAIVYGDPLDVQGYPPDCPFSSQRAGRTVQMLRQFGMLDKENVAVIPPAAAEEAVLRRFHTREYLEALAHADSGDFDHRALRCGLGTPDCPVFAGMFTYARWAVGATLTAVDALLAGRCDVAVNFSGGFHHARPGEASGFCYLNDIVLACYALLDAGHRVAVLDVDAHHGDAVQEAFYDSAAVTTISLHESGKTLFPGTGDVAELGVRDGYGHAINAPLPPGTYDAAYLRVVDEVALPAVRKVAPDVLVMVLGMDGLAQDPLAHLNLTNNAYADVVERVMDLGLPLLVTGGGGYSVADTVRGWALCAGVLINGDQDDRYAFAGIGGDLMQNSAWLGGLRDRVFLSQGGVRSAVDASVTEVIAYLRRHLL